MLVVTVGPPAVWAVWVVPGPGAAPAAGVAAAGAAAGWAGAAAGWDGAAAGAVVVVVAGAVVVVVGALPPPRRAAADAGLGRTRSRAAAPVGRRAISHGTRLPCLRTPILAAAASAQPVHLKCVGPWGRLAAPPVSPGFLAPAREPGKRLTCGFATPRGALEQCWSGPARALRRLCRARPARWKLA